MCRPLEADSVDPRIYPGTSVPGFHIPPLRGCCVNFDSGCFLVRQRCCSQELVGEQEPTTLVAGSPRHSYFNKPSTTP